MGGTEDAKRGTPGGLPQEKVEDRPNVGTVTPDDYPEAEKQAQRDLTEAGKPSE